MGERFKELESFYRGKRVLVTGHTGFKGSYLCLLLTMFGAETYGYALKPPTDPSIFSIIFEETDKKELAPRICDEGRRLHSCIGDVRDYEALRTFYKEAAPDIVIHLAAQPIVRESYVIPRETYEINVMGTVNLLECIRTIPGCRSVLNVTTDKVYLNEEKKGYGYREEDRLDGFDPYSNSKSCSELVTHSYSASFLKAAGASVSSARAGNVIGGGDFANDRIIPDCVRAASRGERIFIRNPYSVRPYQHVLEPLYVYLEICALSGEDKKYEGWYNVGPDDRDCVTTGELSDMFTAAWGEGIAKENAKAPDGPHEANFLKLDNSKIKDVFSWSPNWDVKTAVKKTVDWSKAWLKGNEDANLEMEKQIREFFG